MSQFKSRPPRNGEDASTYAYDQFASVEKAFAEPAEMYFLAELNREPSKLRAGMIVLADGVNWNPGAGQGVYCYYGSAWNKLG